MDIRSLVKKLIPHSLFRKIEPYGHLGEAVVLNIINGFPARGMKFIGVTGTDGKTTTSTMIAQMLRESGKKVALVTTISVDYGDGKGERQSPTSLTTASVPLLLKIIKRIKANGVEWVVLETSSFALAQHRVWGIPYEIAVITNITHEHLDYHGTFDRYIQAKRLLFEQTNRNKKGLRTGIINGDDPNLVSFAGTTEKSVVYGFNRGDVTAHNIKLNSGGSRFIARARDKEYRIECHLPGKFNVSNALAAVAVGMVLGLTKDQIEAGIASLQRVAGRMERIETGQPFEVIVDYAVTPEALKNVLGSAKSISKGAVHLVFGATGDRDKEKRPLMGQVATELADFIYLTDDETYTEDPDVIRSAVYAGIEKAGGAGKAKIIADRREAIKAALDAAKSGDTILLTGIGHQNYRNMGGQKQAWNESEVVHDLLSSK